MSEYSILNSGFELSLKPSRYPDFFTQFRTAYEKNNWTVQEISFSTDKADLREKLTSEERHVVSRLVAFFATGDQIVCNNAAVNLYRHVNSPEARMYYSRQIYEEALHIDFYKTLLEEYVPDADEQIEMFQAVINIPSIKQKAEFCFKWMDQIFTGYKEHFPKFDINDVQTNFVKFAELIMNGNTFVLSQNGRPLSVITNFNDFGDVKLETDEQKKAFLMNLITFACAVEGLFFFAAFAYVYYLRDRGLLHGLASGTNWVFRDESAHMRFAFSLIDVIRKETPHLWDGMENRIREMLAEAIDCELQFANDVLSVGVIGLGQKDMLEYLRYVADGHCKRLGMEPMYNAVCPFDFMLTQDVQALTSFFERTVAEYTVGISGKVDLNVEDF